VSPDEAVVHADDEGLLRGRAAFETLRVYDGRPFRLREHLDRLVFSAERIGLPPLDPAELEALAAQAVSAAGAPDAVLRLLWTPGRDGDGNRSPLAIALVTAVPPHFEDWRRHGIRCISLLGVGGEAPWLLRGVKSTSYAVNMAAEAEAQRRGADDAVFVDRDGIVLEGPVTNVWWRRGETLFTPATDLGILAGVTRAVLLEAAPEVGYAVEEGAYALNELAAADEAFTSSTVREVVPVVELDGEPVGAGRPGPAARALGGALRNSTQSR
jgi:branched-subunit amino acid aminotransferase/4-amino-4-deoxychorismate lyase